VIESAAGRKRAEPGQWLARVRGCRRSRWRPTEICTRLDGIPLAIELAAARVAALRPADIAGLLDERFRLLTGGRADVAGRQQTLQATVEWSYALLGEDERRVFDCLGVFPGSFDAAAAAAVADAGGLERWDILDGLTALVGKSMVVEEEGPDQTSRYRLLETMRAYARQQLAATGKPNGPRRRHAEHYRSPPAGRSASVPIAVRSGGARRWTTTRSPITHWASSVGSPP
jgi:predicted ATPase